MQVGRRPLEERGIEGDHVETLARDGLEEVPLADVDPVLEPVQERVDPGAADRLRVQVDGDDGVAGPCEREGADPRAGPHVERAGRGRVAAGQGRERVGQEDSGAEDDRVEDVGENEDRETVPPLEDEAPNAAHEDGPQDRERGR